MAKRRTGRTLQVPKDLHEFDDDVWIATTLARGRRKLRRAVRRVAQDRGPQRRRHRQRHGHRGRQRDTSSSTSATSPKASSRSHEFTDAEGKVARQGRRRGRRLPREPRERRRPVRPLQGEGRQAQGVGRDLGRVRARRAHRRHHQRAREGRPLGHHPRRREGVPARARRSTCARCATSTSSSARATEFKVIKFNKKRGNIVLSRRVLLEKERDELKEQTLEQAEGRPDRRGHRQEPHRVRRLHRPRRHRRPAAHHRHVLGPRQPPVRAVPGRRRRPRQGPQVQRRDRARLAGPQADHGRSLDPRPGEVPARHAWSRGKVVSLTDYGAFIELEQGIEGLIHVSEMSLDPPGQAPVEGAGHRRHGRGGGARRRPAPEPHQPRHEAARAQPVRARSRRSTRPAPWSRARSATSPTSASSWRSKRASTAWCTSRDLSLDPAGQAPVGALPEGRRGRGGGPQHRVRRREAQGLARHQAAGARSVGSHPVRLPGRAASSTPRSSRCSTSARSWRSRRASRASSTSRSSPTSASRTRKNFVKPGQALKAEIISVDTAERKIGLSFRGAARAEEVADAQGFTGGAPTATLGDVMRDKLAALTQPRKTE